MLTENEIKAIRIEAEKFYPTDITKVRDIQTVAGFIKVDRNLSKRLVAVEILMSERIKAKKLLDGLQQIRTDRPRESLLYKFITQVINEYNKTQP